MIWGMDAGDDAPGSSLSKLVQANPKLPGRFPARLEGIPLAGRHCPPLNDTKYAFHKSCNHVTVRGGVASGPP